MLNRQVLVLNKHWTAVHVCSVKRALSLVFQEVARIVSDDFQTHDFESWRDLSEFANRKVPVLHTPHFQMMLPQVIVLQGYNRMPPRTVKFNRRNIFQRDQYTCQYCGCQPRDTELTIDHVLPRSRGGRTTWENVVLACVRCNTTKGNRLPCECNMHPQRPPRKPTWLQTLARLDHAEDNRSVWQKFVDTAYWETKLLE